MDKIHGFLTKLCRVRKTFQVNITLLTLPFCSLTSLSKKDDDTTCKMLLDSIIENYKDACYLFLFPFLCLASLKIALISSSACNPMNSLWSCCKLSTNSSWSKTSTITFVTTALNQSWSYFAYPQAMLSKPWRYFHPLHLAWFLHPSSSTSRTTLSTDAIIQTTLGLPRNTASMIGDQPWL